MIETEFYTEDGAPKVYPTARPFGTVTCFYGGDDNGNLLLFNLLAADASKHVDLTYNDDVYIKDGFMIVKGAPFGARMNVSVRHPSVGHIKYYCKDIPLFGDGWFPLDTEDKAKMPAGIILRVEVVNSTGQNGQDVAADFKVAGRIEMYRVSP